MKRFLSLICALLLVCIAVVALVGCQNVKNPTDYASSYKLEMQSSTRKMFVTVKSYIDGDTTHFNVP